MTQKAHEKIALKSYAAVAFQDSTSGISGADEDFRRGLALHETRRVLRSFDPDFGGGIAGLEG
jgi:hypothetical protein